MRQSGHAGGKVARVHGKRDGLGFEEALEDSRQGAGLLILQRVISFCEDGISARVELQLRNQERTVAIAVHRFEPFALILPPDSWCGGEADDPPKFRRVALCMQTRSSAREDRLTLGWNRLRPSSSRPPPLSRSIDAPPYPWPAKDPLGRGKQPLPG